jgi:hypothetical protein
MDLRPRSTPVKAGLERHHVASAIARESPEFGEHGDVAVVDADAGANEQCEQDEAGTGGKSNE